MLEIPESLTLARQLPAAAGRTIVRAEANHSPHRFAWYQGDPAAYAVLLAGRTLGRARQVGGFVELEAGPMRLLFQDGVNLRLLAPGAKLPLKHQLLLELDDGAYLAATVQMYGGLLAYQDGELENPYFERALQAPNPLSDAFDESYFCDLCRCEGFETLSAKAFLATKQRIPGLGNGVLQDILWHAGIHPKQRMGALPGEARGRLFRAVRQTLAAMAEGGGRDTEQDLFGQPGGYRTVLSRHTANTPCPACGEIIRKESYLGGSVYYCPQCQPLNS